MRLGSELLPFLLAAFGASGAAVKRKPTGGHRNKDYKPNRHDFDRIEAAQVRRDRRGEKAQQDYNRCIANNPCLYGRAGWHRLMAGGCGGNDVVRTLSNREARPVKVRPRHPTHRR